MNNVRENLHSANRTDWLRRIMEIYQTEYSAGDRLTLSFNGLTITKMDPWHIVTLACLVESLDRRNIIVSLDRSEECGEYFFSGLKLGAYWKGKKDYTTADKSTVLNLWHIMPESTEDHARRTVEYLRNRFFKRKDLSSVTLSLLEAYYNINDHSKSDGNAFSMLSFDEDTEVLNVAVCDFGIGIAESVKDFDCTITDDKEALSKAIEAKFTVGSKAHNAGLGLLNIRNVCTEKDNLWIISNCAALALTDTQERAYDLGFNFQGTLLTYNVSLSHFEDEDTLDGYEW